MGPNFPTGCSEHASVWSEKAIKIYSSALCRPQKGAFGEVAAAFYMLACGDEMRYEQSPDLTQLSVPIEKWIGRLQQRKGADCKTSVKAGAPKPSVNFIQVCRNHLHHSLKEIQDSGLLRHWYLAGRASYAYATCEAYDIVVPLQYTLDGALHYCPMLVSVKNRVAFSPKQRQAAIEAMKKVFEGADIETGVCVLLLICLDEPFSESFSTLQFSHHTVSTVVIEVPKEEDFGATNLALCSTCGGGNESEVMVSHSELALGADYNFERLPFKKISDDDPSRLLLKEITEGYSSIASDEENIGEATTTDERSSK